MLQLINFIITLVLLSTTKIRDNMVRAAGAWSSVHSFTNPLHLPLCRALYFLTGFYSELGCKEHKNLESRPRLLMMTEWLLFRTYRMKQNFPNILFLTNYPPSFRIPPFSATLAGDKVEAFLFFLFHREPEKNERGYFWLRGMVGFPESETRDSVFGFRKKSENKNFGETCDSGFQFWSLPLSFFKFQNCF